MDIFSYNSKALFYINVSLKHNSKIITEIEQESLYVCTEAYVLVSMYLLYNFSTCLMTTMQIIALGIYICCVNEN